MNKGLLFKRYNECYTKARSRNTELSLGEKKCKKWFLGIGLFVGIGIGIGFILTSVYFKEEDWLHKVLIIEFSCFSFALFFAHLFDVIKAIKLFKTKQGIEIVAIIKGDWRTHNMKEDEQQNFKFFLIENGVLVENDESKNLVILEADQNYFLSLAGRKTVNFKENLKTYSGIYLVFFTAIFGAYIKTITHNPTLYNLFIICMIVASLICFVRLYITRLVLDEVRVCLMICDELTEIKNDIIRKRS